MNKWKIGILGASDIAYKRFLPALQKSRHFTFVGIASRNPERCAPFIKCFGGQCYPDYDSLLLDAQIDCVYLPLPPARHAYWGEKVLAAGKHLLMEKPFTVLDADTKNLLSISRQRGLAVYENYMFLHHRQLTEIKNIMASETLGSIRMIRTAFTFPFRGVQDFRYDSKLGGGALLDCGGYPLLLASELLGDSAQLQWSSLKYDDQYGVDTAGSAVLLNHAGLTAHVFFGMDDTYRCELEVWGSKASLTASRIFTAPPDLPIILRLNGGNEERSITITADDQFQNSIDAFAALIERPALRRTYHDKILRQSALIANIQNKGS
ncbi:MAG: Gfo/Idh/MocA family protein [Candidatus Fimivivens sp.]